MNSLARHGLLSAALVLSLASNFGAETRLIIVDDSTAERIPARIHLLNSEGIPLRPSGYPSWHDHFVCDGTATLTLPDGSYTYTVERGPEFSAAKGGFAVREGQSTDLPVRLRRIANLAAEGWFGGETHVHRGLDEIKILMRAEDLHAAQVITWWNKTNPWREKALPDPVTTRFDQNRFYHATSGEDERDGGALLYCDLSRPLNITAGAQHFPSSLVYARQARTQGAKWLDVEKPFWWDFPMWVAHGVADTVGIAHNHMHRAGVYPGEAWGRPRELSKYPGPHGNGLWTQQIYYHALNCGVRLPPSAGSASGVLPNPVGYNRAYVHIEGDFTYEKWRDGLLAGRSFVSNGPLLRGRAGGQLPGHVFKSNGPLELIIEGRLDSRDPIQALELVRNGKVEPVTLPARIALDRSGWFLVRAVADLTNTFHFASTAPWYVEIGGRPLTVPPESARFFLDWCQERIETLDKLSELNPAQKEQVIAPWRIAQKFWSEAGTNSPE